MNYSHFWAPLSERVDDSWVDCFCTGGCNGGKPWLHLSLGSHTMEECKRSLPPSPRLHSSARLLSIFTGAHPVCCCDLVGPIYVYLLLIWDLLSAAMALGVWLVLWPLSFELNNVFFSPPLSAGAANLDEWLYNWFSTGGVPFLVPS